jgi:hypothetical protein
MKCRRCGGFLVQTDLVDAQQDYSNMWCRGLRCINCGAIEETGMQENQGKLIGQLRKRRSGRIGRPPRPRAAMLRLH